MIIEFNKPTNPPPKGGKPSKKPSVPYDSSESPSKEHPGENRGTLIVDAACAPQNIRFPQDVQEECPQGLSELRKKPDKDPEKDLECDKKAAVIYQKRH